MSSAKRYLQKIRKLDRMIEQRIKERDSLRQFDGVTAIAYDKDPVQTSPKGNAPFESTVEKLIALEQELDRLIDEYVTLKDKIIGEIHELNNTNYITLLYKRYVEYKTFELIAVEMHYTYDWVREMHGYALLEFERTHTNPQRDML